MTQKPDNAGTDMKGAASPARPDADRRRFLVAGLAAAPLIVTLSARPAFARNDATAYGTSRGIGGTNTLEVLEPTFTDPLDSGTSSTGAGGN